MHVHAPAGQACEPIDGAGTVLGAFEEVRLGDVPIEMQRGDQLVLYTDGVIDARRAAERFGMDRLRQVVDSCTATNAGDLTDAIEGAVLDFNDDPLPDDAAIVTMTACRLPVDDRANRTEV